MTYIMMILKKFIYQKNIKFALIFLRQKINTNKQTKAYYVQRRIIYRR